MFIVSQEINETKILLLVANNATHFDIQSEIHKELFSHKTISFRQTKKEKALSFAYLCFINYMYALYCLYIILFVHFELLSSLIASECRAIIEGR